MLAIAQHQLWDFDAVETGPAVTDLTGELRFSGLSVGLCQPSVSGIRRAESAGVRLIRQPGGLHFQPDSRRYAGSRIKPSPAKWLRQRNLIERLARDCAEHKLLLHGRIDLSDLSQVLERAPLAGTVSVFGETNSRRLCPSNPEARSFLESLVDDISENYGLAAVELSGWGFATDIRQSDPSLTQTACSSLESQLLTLCFCPACRERAVQASIDVDRVAARVSAALGATFQLETPPDLTFADFLTRNPDIASFEGVRRQTVLDQLAGLRQRSKCPIVLQLEAGTHAPADAALRELAGSVLVPDGNSDPELKADVGALRLADWDADRIQIALNPAPPNHRDAQSLVRRILNLGTAGHSTVHLGPMGELPPPCREWIRQALRYAKRESAP